MIQLQAVGRLGKDAEVKTLDSGKKVINFSIAIDQGFGDNKTTLWLTCKKWGENTKVSEFLKKGTQVAVAGEPTMRSYTNKEGKEVSSLELTCQVITLVGTSPAQQAAAPAPQKQTSEAEQEDLPF